MRLWMTFWMNTDRLIFQPWCISLACWYDSTFKIGWHFGWYVLRWAYISGQTLATCEHLFAGAVTLQISKNKVIWSCTAVCLWEGVLSRFIQASFNASHSPFLCFQGPTSGHVKLIVDRLLRRINRTVINLSLDSPFIVRCHKMECCRKI